MEFFDKVLAKWSNLIFDTMDLIKEKTGRDVEKMMIDSRKKDEKLREEHPFRWALKRLGFGTFKGLFGAGTHSLFD